MRDDQRLLENFALRVAAADPGRVRERRLEHPRGLEILAPSERRRPQAKGRSDRPRRQATVLGEAIEPADSTLQFVVVPGRGPGEGRVEIGEGETGPGKVPPRLRGDLDPLLVDRWVCSIKLPAPQE